MDPRLLQYYNRELQHVREMGAEFAKAYPKIAGRLTLDGVECSDPYVERLLEGFSFLAARVQLKLDAEFPQFTQHLLEMVYPHYLVPTPSMAVVCLTPDPGEGALMHGVDVPKMTPLRSLLGRREQTACEFRTAHSVKLWPLQVSQVEYFTHARGLSGSGIPDCKAGLRIRLKTTDGQPIKDVAIENLDLYLNGADEIPGRLYEQFFANGVGVVGRATGSGDQTLGVLPKSSLVPLGFEEEESLLPFPVRSFSGYRLLHEYFAFPQRYLFARIEGLQTLLRRSEGDEIDLLVLFDRRDNRLERSVSTDHLKLHCTPAINLTQRRVDRIHVKQGRHEYHVVPDRTRPQDYEIYAISDVAGHGSGAESEQRFYPFYSTNDRRHGDQSQAFYSLLRRPRVLSDKQKRTGTRSSYVGSELYVSLVDAKRAPFRSDLKQISMNALCTNRDLPMHMSIGQGRTDFNLGISAPVQSIRCLAGPTRPRSSWAEGDTAWRLISHLSLNYLSLVDSKGTEGAGALRELLALYANVADASTQKQVEGVASIDSKPIVRRLPVEGPISFGRGVEVELRMDENAFEGSGVFVLGSVLERFFAKYVGLNSFTETRLVSTDRGEIKRWPARRGKRQLI